MAIYMSSGDTATETTGSNGSAPLERVPPLASIESYNRQLPLATESYTPGRCYRLRRLLRSQRRRYWVQKNLPSGAMVKSASAIVHSVITAVDNIIKLGSII